MFFSIIIPCYNAEVTITKTLASCLNQTFTDYEIIIIDDCSTDNTINLIKEINSDNIKTYKLSSNKGPSYARNYGWEKATGDYICFLDSDDIWYYKKLEIIANILATNKIHFLAHGFSVKDFNFEQINKNKKNTLKKINYKSLLLLNKAITPCVVIQNKNIKERFDESMKYCEDHDLWVRIAIKYDLYYLPIKLTTLNRPILQPGGLSSSRLKMRIGEIKVFFNISKLKKWIILFLPILILYSLFKYMLNIFITLPSNKTHKKRSKIL